MTTQTTTTVKGRIAEDLAVLHLQRIGYIVHARNVRHGKHEIDVVASDGPVLCFVEVRARKSVDEALSSVSLRKQSHLIACARAYIAQQSVTAPCRFDVVTVVGARVELVKAAFEVPA